MRTEEDYGLNPGSDEAFEQGCTCPRMDNGYGRGWKGTDKFVIAFDCPLHGKDLQENDDNES